MSENRHVPALFRPLGWGEPSVSEGGFVLPSGTVTLLLGDVEGSTRAWEADPKSAEAAIRDLNDIVDELVGCCDGVRPVEQGEGDSFVAAFARARDGVACALEVQRALVGHLLAVRLGVHTGDVTRRDEGNYVGPTIIRTARLRNLAHGGQTVVSEATRELVAETLPDGARLRDLGVHRLKDLSRPERVYQLCHPDLRDEFPALRSLDARPNNLPVQRTTFIGRERELAQLSELIGAGERLVTLTGAGGSGKTRLAVQVGAEMLETFPDGVWVVDLAAVSDGEAVPAAVLQVLSLKEGPAMSAPDALVTYLGGRRALIVFDNCEHLLDAAARLIDALLGACPGVSMVATSRQSLALEGEVVWRVPSLPCPAPDRATGIVGVSSSDAVQLFADRARRARPGFTLSESNAGVVAEICRRLDGIPLAIELAAARVRVFTPSQIADALSERFRLLTGAARTALPRQQTLEASVDWSYDLLTDVERQVLRRLAVFAGGFAFDAVQAVCEGSLVEAHQVLDQLTLLVDKSLVVADVDDDGEAARYRLLETVRAYAARHLEASGEGAATRDRHCDYYLGLVRGAGGHLEGPSHAEWAATLAREYPNIRAALEWAHSRGDAELVATSVVALALFWSSHGPNAEGTAWLQAALAGDLAPSLRAQVAFARGWLAGVNWDLETMVAAAHDALALAEDVHDARLATRCRVLLGMADGVIGAPPHAIEQAVEEARSGGDEWILTAGLTWLGVAHVARDLDKARAAFEEAVRVGRASNVAMSRQALSTLAFTWTLQGDMQRARRELEASVAEQEGSLDRATLAGTLVWLAYALIELGEHAEALRVVDRLEAIAHDGGLRLFDALALNSRSTLALAQGDPHGAIAFAERALALAYTPPARSGALAFLAEAEVAAGRRDAARAHAFELTKMARPGDDGDASVPHQLPEALLVTASLDRLDGDLGRAEVGAHEAVVAAQAIRARNRVIDGLEMIASIVADLASVEEAARLVGATEAARAATGYGRRFAARDLRTSSLRDAMGDEAFEHALHEGRALTLDEAVAYARRGRGERKRPTTGWASLTPIEAQVVDLVRQGMTNAEIGARVFVSPRTVQAHLSRIYTKLGVNGRTSLAALPNHLSNDSNPR